MERIAAFEKVSYGQFKEGYLACCGEAVGKTIRKVYDSIRLPVRATSGSAGYDFFLPYPLSLSPGESQRVPTGIRCRMEEGWVLLLFPRSSFGFKYRLQLDNTVGVIDSDYYGSDNEGHIFIKITNDSREGKTVRAGAGEGFAQGVFLPFGITADDDAEGKRNGGIGSTSKN